MSCSHTLWFQSRHTLRWQLSQVYVGRGNLRKLAPFHLEPLPSQESPGKGRAIDVSIRFPELPKDLALGAQCPFLKSGAAVSSQVHSIALSKFSFIRRNSCPVAFALMKLPSKEGPLGVVAICNSCLYLFKYSKMVPVFNYLPGFLSAGMTNFNESGFAIALFCIGF